MMNLFVRMKKSAVLQTAAIVVLGVTQVTAQSVNEGLKAIEVEKYSKAKQIFNSLIAKNPADADNYYYVGKVYLLTDKLDSAKIYFNKGLAANPNSVLNYIGMGQLALEADNSIEYQKDLDKALALGGPKDIKTMIAVSGAYISMSNKKADKALAIANQAIALDSKNPEANLALGDAYLEQNNGGLAASSYEKALQYNKNYAKAQLRIGQLYTRARNFNEAAAGFNNALAIDSTYAPAYKEMAELEFQWKKYDAAVADYQKYLRLADNNIENLSRYASFVFMNKDYAKSIDVINTVFRIDSSNVVMKRLLAYSMYEKGDYAGGLKYINKFFGQVEKKKILPSDFEYLGKLQSKNNLDSLAIISFKRSLDMDNTQNDLLSDIGNSYNKLKKYKEAANYYGDKIARVKKLVSTDYFFLGRALYFDQQYAKADSAFIKVTEMQPAWPTGYIWRGRCNQQMDTVEPLTYAAKAYFDKAVEVGSKDMVKFKKDLVEAYDYIGKYFIKKDDNTAAKETFKKILEIDPENQAAKDILKQIK